MPARYNEVLVIDSIPERDFNTAKPLVRDMEDWRAAVGGNPPTVSYRRVEDAQEFLSLLSDLGAGAEDGSYVPLLHIECHGSTDGLGFADDSFLAWRQIAPSLQALNISTRLNLIVLVAACDGSYLTMAMEVHDRAPVWAVLGPARKIQAGHLRDSFSAYYSMLFMTGSSAEAYKALKATSEGSIFTLISAEQMFREVCVSYPAPMVLVVRSDCGL